MYPTLNLIYFCYSLESLFAAKNYSMLFPNVDFGQTLSGSSGSILRVNPPSISSLLLEAPWTKAKVVVESRETQGKRFMNAC